MSFEAGQLVTENVRLLRHIGEGGMGSVWVAEHLTLDTEVAVKFMAPELATHPDAVERFTREARAAARMRSPHVVRIFDYGAPKGGVPFMIMELLEGEDLEERVSRSGPLSTKDAIDVVTQLAKALGEAHANGIVHRDVKPDNVFLTHCAGDLFVKVLDFGIAKQAGRALARVTCSGTTVGTPIYMSPEQILSAKDVDYRCDLWSLAVVAYYCLTGRVPFEGETFGAVCIAIDRGRMRPPSSLRAEVPSAVDAWFAKALARDIDRRFQSAKEMADAFAAAMREAPSWSSRLSMAVTVPRIPRPTFARRPTLVGGVISAAPRSRARARVGTYASIGAAMLMLVGAMDLGRAWFGHPPVDARALLASPPLAYAGTVVAPAPPPSAPTNAAPPVVDARDLKSPAEKAEAAAGAVANNADPERTMTARSQKVVPAARSVTSPATEWSRRPKRPHISAILANAVSADAVAAVPTAAVAVPPTAATNDDRASATPVSAEATPCPTTAPSAASAANRASATTGDAAPDAGVAEDAGAPLVTPPPSDDVSSLGL